MKTKLVIFALLFVAFGCAPSAHFTEYNVKYKHQNEIYNPRVRQHRVPMPPDVPEAGKSYAIDIGDVVHIRTYGKHHNYVTWVSCSELSYPLPIQGSPKEMKYYMPAYLLMSNETGDGRQDYLVVDDKRYYVLTFPAVQE